MKRVLLTAGISLLIISVKAQQNFDTALIPKELLSYSSAVVRYSDEEFEVKAIDNVVYHVKEAVTILNKNGDREAGIALYYKKGTSSVKLLKGNVYNAAGKLTGKFADRDFEDASAAGEASLFDDWRVKHFQPSVIDYPYTIECEYEVRSKQTLNPYNWNPNPGNGVSVEKSTFSFICKPDFKINYKELNTPQRALISTTEKGLNVYCWQLNNLKSIKSEPYSPDPEKYATSVKIVPEKFTYGDISGSFSDWNGMGKWVYEKLLRDRDAVPSATVDYIKQLTADIADEKLKAKKIYEYMQQKTRYISIQVGIGGYQPFPASDVDKTGYGDCKALVNYTHALLKAVNIDSWYCVVKSGSRKKSFMRDFASMDQGDHIILCLPFKGDTTWAECTDQKIPFGYLGDFTDDRWVLACTPEGGKLLHTPRYSADANQTSRKGDFTIDDKGNLTGSMITRFEGTDYDTRYGIIDESYSEQLKSLKRAYPISNLDIEKLKFTKASTIKPVTTEDMKFNAREFAALNADKFYFKPDLANRTVRIPDEVRNRTTDVYINRGFVELDEMTFKLPPGYKPEKPLTNHTVTKPFGKYTLSMHLNGDELFYKRRLQMNDGTYPKDMYQELVDFLLNAAEWDNHNMVLIKGS